MYGRSVERAVELAGYFNAGGGGGRVRVIESFGSKWPREF